MDHAAECWRRYLDGEERAFDEIMKELFSKLIFFIYRYVADWNAAEDLAIDTFSELIVHPHRYHFKVSLKTYLFMIGRCRALDYLKRRRLIRFDSLSEAGELMDEQAGPEEQFLKKEQKRALLEAMEKLPEAMQAAVYLVYFEELSYQEAAKVLKCNRKQIDNLLYRAKKELRASFGEEVLLS